MSAITPIAQVSRFVTNLEYVAGIVYLVIDHGSAAYDRPYRLGFTMDVRTL